jgi:hypothetical protein
VFHDTFEEVFGEGDGDGVWEREFGGSKAYKVGVALSVWRGEFEGDGFGVSFWEELVEFIGGGLLDFGDGLV